MEIIMGEKQLGIGLALVSMLLVASGCSESKVTAAASVDSSKKTFSLAIKEIDKTVDLVNPRTNKVLYELNQSNNAKEFENEVKGFVSDLANKVDQPMIPSKLDSNGKLIHGKSRVILDEEKTVQRLLGLTAHDNIVELPIEETKPNVSAETVNGITNTVIGSYKTSFDPSVKGRSTNIAISAKEFDQVVLGPGDRFYFNLVVGERTTERGYQKAMEIVNKEFVEGIGGGICQTSSTLYNAVEKAGLEIIERHNHSRSIGYVPAGKDATVAWGFKDFKFANNKDFPVMLKTIVDQVNGTIEVQVLAASKI
ncbi:VanW family protein [Metabacillus arenae]|uniref:VanW family protein n=1 Tax=Metabacillus arenae TaxID=2771434 RepID=A0A926NIU2_9BACI|nr:VanW family protein [Metabacillus arenae]MBD1378912.1 VanW family protein [Metabacillus arenae]